MMTGVLPTLFTEASLVAVPFFQRHGFRIVEEQTVVSYGVQLRRCAMRGDAHAVRPPPC